MYIILYISIIICSYVATFKSDFKDEDIQKALPILVIIIVLSVFSVISGS